MGLPIEFRRSGEGAVASYDWFDFASGAGYKRYYCAGAYETTNPKYFLTTNSNIDGDYDNLSISTSSDLDFDITFNTPLTIAGADAIFNWTIYLVNAAATSSVAINVYHVTSGGTETSIGTATSKTFTASGAGYIRQCLKFGLTQKSFGVGEKLRINVIWTETDASANIRLFFDPASRQSVTEGGTGATITTDFTCDIPFRIDL